MVFVFFLTLVVPSAGKLVRVHNAARMTAELAADATTTSSFEGADPEPNSGELPKALDWSKTDKLVEPGDQGGFCNSCYIWAALAVAEGRHAVATNQAAVRQSTQEVIDCARRPWMNSPPEGISQTWRKWGVASLGRSKGCQTGETAQVLQFAVDLGIQAADVYPVPYERRETYERDRDWTKEHCQATGPSPFRPPTGSKVRSAARRGTFADWEGKVLRALQAGPVAVSIDKSSHSVFATGDGLGGKPGKPKDCRTKNPDHAVAIVGYGDGDQGPYWVVRNSWGPFWGEQGYMRLPRGKNICGVEQNAWWIEYPAGAPAAAQPGRLLSSAGSAADPREPADSAGSGGATLALLALALL